MHCSTSHCPKVLYRVRKYNVKTEKFFFITNALSYIYKHNYRAQTNILNIHKNNKHVEIRKRTIVHVCGFVHVA